MGKKIEAAKIMRRKIPEGKGCPICEGRVRKEIHECINNLDIKKLNQGIREIAYTFNLSVEEVREHVLHHSNDITSMVQEMNVKEANTLNELVEEYMGTMKRLGREIREYENYNPIDAKLYIQCGETIIKATNELAHTYGVLKGISGESGNGGITEIAKLSAMIGRSMSNDRVEGV